MYNSAASLANRAIQGFDPVYTSGGRLRRVIACEFEVFRVHYHLCDRRFKCKFEWESALFSALAPALLGS
jgi:hypothetical protein